MVKIRYCIPHILLCTLVFITVFFLPLQSNAQSLGALSAHSGSSLVLSPRYPEPNQEVTISLNDFTINTQGAKIQWFINGEHKAAFDNQRSIQHITGPLGSTDTILARTTLPNGSVLKAKKNITPIRIDMLVEADTLAPPFYKGRTIPSSGSLVRVTAIPFTGKTKSPTSYSYIWKIGNNVQQGGSVYGKNFTTFTPGFEKNVHVSVDVIDKSGTRVGQKSISIPITDPELYFYEINPLRGISQTAMRSPYIFIGDEMQIRAEPYFIDKNILKKNPLLQWKLNGKTIKNPSGDPQEITLRKEGDSGSFTLEFHIRNLQQLLQGVKESITITF